MIPLQTVDRWEWTVKIIRVHDLHPYTTIQTKCRAHCNQQSLRGALSIRLKHLR